MRRLSICRRRSLVPVSAEWILFCGQYVENDPADQSYEPLFPLLDYKSVERMFLCVIYAGFRDDSGGPYAATMETGTL